MKKYPNIRVVYDRTNQASRAKTASVLIEVQLGGKKKYLNTGVKVYKNEWDQKKNKVTARNDMFVLNEQIDTLLNKVKWLVVESQRNDTFFSLDSLDTIVKKQKDADFREYAKYYIDSLKIKDSSKQAYAWLIDGIEKHSTIRNVSDLNNRNIDILDSNIRAICKPTRVSNIHTFLQRICSRAYKDKIISCNPYLEDDYSVKGADVRDIKYLSMEQLEMIEDYKPDAIHSSMQLTIDRFLFCCYTGLSSADLRDFDATIIQDGIYKRNRFKTGTEFVTIILPQAQRIIDKHGDRLPLKNDRGVWVYRNAMQRLSKLIGFKITSHMARHTFATTVALANDIPLVVVSKMLGHKKVSTTEIYAKVIDGSVAAARAKLMERFKVGS